MKKITFLLSLALAVAMNVSAADGDSQWINYLDTNNASGTSPLVVEYDANSVYWLSTAATADKDANYDVLYNGEKLFDGSKSTSTSSNQNVCLIKFNKSGEKLYSLYSNRGETWTNQNGVVAMKDGGAVIVLRMRHSQGYESEPINFVDGKGADHTIDWECGDDRYNALVVLKIDSEGAIQWSRLIDVDHTFNGKHVATSVDLLAVEGDDNDNVYLGGRYVMPMHFPNADGTETVITPDNMNNYDGDFTQYDNGDLFLVKLDSNGYFVKNVANKGIVKKGSIQSMMWADGALYTLGYMKGVEGESCVFGGTTLSPLANVFNMVLAKFDTDLNAEWVSIINGERDATYGANVIQNTSIFKAGDNLWIGGMGNGKFFDPNTGVSVCSKNKMREGYIFKASAKDGSLVAAQVTSSYNTKTGIIGYFGAIQNPAGTGDVWSYGYTWAVNPAPIFMHAMDGSTLAYNESASFDLITGMTTTMYDMAYDPIEGVIYYTGRSKGTPAPKGLEPGEKAVNWKGFIGKAVLPASLKASTSAIAEVALGEGLEVRPGAGCLTVVNNGADTTVYVCDIVGRQVAAEYVAGESTAAIELPAGLYIAAGKKILVK